MERRRIEKRGKTRAETVLYSPSAFHRRARISLRGRFPDLQVIAFAAFHSEGTVHPLRRLAVTVADVRDYTRSFYLLLIQQDTRSKFFYHDVPKGFTQIQAVCEVQSLCIHLMDGSRQLQYTRWKVCCCASRSNTVACTHP